MMELKTLKIDSDVHDFIECYEHNSELVGGIAVRLDVYGDFIKILTAFPLTGKKLNYFLKLDRKSKTGFMSKYIMKIAKSVNVPNAVIKNFQEIKESSKFYKKYKPTPEEVGVLYNEDPKEFLNKYSYVVKEETYKELLSSATSHLCSSIFEQYDKVKNQMIKEQ